MRRRFLPPVAALAALLGAADARAGTLTSATWETGWRGAYGATPSFTVPVTASGTSTPTSVSIGVAVPAFASSVSLPGVPLQSPSATLTLNGAQLVTATAGMAKATTGIPGALMTRVPAATVFKAPLQVGLAGIFTGTFTVLGVLNHITVDHYAWTAGTLTLTGLTSSLAPLPDLVVMGTFDLTANGGGTVQLVSPAKITAVSSLPYRTVVSVTTLTLHFVPEPGSLLLLGAAAVALAAARRRQRLD